MQLKNTKGIVAHAAYFLATCNAGDLGWCYFEITLDATWYWQSRYKLLIMTCNKVVDKKSRHFRKGSNDMRVEKREFVWEFSQLSCPGQTRMRVDESWQARICMRVFSTVMFWSNEDESWWELRSESLPESFLNYHVLVKRGWELMRVEKREFVWEFS